MGMWYSRGVDSFPSVYQKKQSLIYRPPIAKREEDYQNLTDHTVHEIIDGISIITSLENSNKYLIFCHGNGMDAYQCVPLIQQLRTIYKVNVIAFDYPTYGLSNGNISEGACIASLNVVISSLPKKSKIILVGHSLGTGVVVGYCHKYKWKQNILLISPFKNLPQVVYNNSIVSSILTSISPTENFESLSKIRYLRCKIQIVHGQADTVINHSHSIALRNTNRSIKLRLYEKANHVDIIETVFNDVEIITPL